MKLMNPTKTVNFMINTYPTLYASSGMEIARLRVYNQIFNTIGNGIRNSIEFANHLRARRKGVQKPLAKYLSGERLYYGYTETEDFVSGTHKVSMPKHGTSLGEVFAEAEKMDHPEVKYWVGFDVANKFVPYPNFKREYSIVWNIDTSLLTNEWITEIIWFYRKCEEFFDGPTAHEYHLALPANPKKLEARIKEQEKSFERYKKENMSTADYWNVITENWKCEYRGDTLDFLQRRWQKEHERIRAFITETIEMLNEVSKENLILQSKLRDNC